MNGPQKRTLTRIALGALTLAIVALYPALSQADEHVIYGVQRGVDLGIQGQAPQKDFYVNLGADQGVQVGSLLEVLRRTSTYDLNTQKLYKDMVYPIGRLRVIHVESNAAIARLDQILPGDKTPVMPTQSLMIGDLVQLTRSR